MFKHIGYTFIHDKESPNESYIYNSKTERSLKSFINTNGYIVLKYDYDKKTHHYKLHRLIATKFIPNPLNLEFVDHIDGNRLNNHINNLRWVTNQQNHCNRTKAKGYCWNKRDNKWMAYIIYNGKKKHLGYFNNENDAKNAYLVAKAERDVKVFNNTKLINKKLWKDLINILCKL